MTINTTANTMRGLFFIIKGQYRRDKSGYDTIGYDPFNPETPEWYMLVDNKTFTCVSCGSDLKKVLRSVHNTIKRHKGDVSRFFKQVSMLSSKVSPLTQELYRKVYNDYGYYYRDLIIEMEDLAYDELKEERPIFKSRKLMAKHKTTQGVYATPVKDKVSSPTPLVRPKKVFGVKKLVME